jgi:alpha-tubulin suppressor-like RCC1 family protein
MKRRSPRSSGLRRIVSRGLAAVLVCAASTGWSQVANPTSSLVQHFPITLESYTTIATSTPDASLHFGFDAAVPIQLHGLGEAPSGAQLLIDRPLVLSIQGYRTGWSPSNTIDFYHFVTGRIVAGGDHAHILRTTGSLRGVGSGAGGKLGNGSTNSTQTFTTTPTLTGVTEVSASTTHSLALLSNRSASAWGQNQRGALGDSSTTNRTSPITPNLMGANVVSVSAGNAYSLFALTNGTVWGSGINDRNQLGDGTTTNRTSPVKTSTITNATAVFASPNGQYSMARTLNATLMAWGRNNDGQLGLGNYTSQSTPKAVPGLTGVVMVAMGFSHSLALTSNGSVYSWGSNSYGQLGHGDQTPRNSPALITTLSNVTWVAAGASCSMALTKTGILYTWGNNSDGQLGTGNLTSRYSPGFVPSLFSVVFAEMGSDFSYAVTWDGRMYSWGNNSAGQLGDGTYLSRSSPAQVAGESPIYALEDVDGDDLPDRWEEIWIDASAVDALDGLEDLTKTADYDGDTISNYNEYLAQTDPSDYYNGAKPKLVLRGGDNQVGPPSSYLPVPFTVGVYNGTTQTPLSNAPVLFEVRAGGAGLATQSGNLSPVSSLVGRTDSNGTVTVYCRQGSGAGITSTVFASAGQAVPLLFETRTHAANAPWAHWKFNAGSGNLAVESAGHSVNGTLMNATQWNAGVDGRGGVGFSGFASENGTQAHVSMGLGNGTLDFGSDSFTVSLWLRFTDVSIPSGHYGRRIISKGHHGWNAGYFIGTHGTGRIEAGIGASQGGSTESILFKTTGEFNDGSWHHVAVVFDRLRGTSRAFVDGVAEPLEKASGSGGEVDAIDPTAFRYPALANLTATRTDIPFTIGSHAGSLDFFKGDIDDVRIYKRALEGDEIEAIYASEEGSYNLLPDAWEYQRLGMVGVDPNADTDQDGWSNAEEYRLGSDPAAFADPPSLPSGGLRMWLRADAGVQADGQGKITQWNDQSGSGHHAVQGNTTRSPVLITSNFTNGKKAVLFDGANDHLGIVDTNGTYTSNATALAVYRLDAGGTGGQYPLTLGGNVALGNGSRLGIEARANGNPTDHTLDATDANGNGQRISAKTVSSNAVVQIVSLSVSGFTHSGDLRSARVSDVPMISSSPTPLGANLSLSFQLGTPAGNGTGGIGGRPLQHVGSNGTGWVMKGAVAESIVFGRTLTTLERWQAEQYLLRRYSPAETDHDGDGFTTTFEESNGLDPMLADTNGDGVLDAEAYAQFGLDFARLQDFDLDGLDTATEMALGLNPWWADTDGDGAADGADYAPFDPLIQSPPTLDPADTTPPGIIITFPVSGITPL